MWEVVYANYAYLSLPTTLVHQMTQILPLLCQITESVRFCFWAPLHPRDTGNISNNCSCFWHYVPSADRWESYHSFKDPVLRHDTRTRKKLAHNADYVGGPVAQLCISLDKNPSLRVIINCVLGDVSLTHKHPLSVHSFFIDMRSERHGQFHFFYVG